MASTSDLVSIKMVADRLYRNPLMKDLSYEFIVDNAIQILRILEAPSLFSTKREALNVVNYRAMKPIDMIKVESVVRTDRGSIPVPLTASEDIAQEFYHQSNNLPSRSHIMNNKIFMYRFTTFWLSYCFIIFFYLL